MTTRGPRISVFGSASPSGTSQSLSLNELLAASPRRRILQACGAALIVLLGLGALSRIKGLGEAAELPYMETPEVDESAEVSYLGMHEEQGWTETSVDGLADLGEIAEQRYRLGTQDQ